MKIIRNVRVVSPDIELENANVAFEDGVFTQLSFGDDISSDVDQIIDGSSLTMMPGFIDVHCHGREGADWTDGTVEAAEKIALGKLREGVTCVLPTTLTIGEDSLLETARAVAQLNAADGQKILPRMPGLHLEGPFINAKCLGAQNPDFVRPPDIAEVKRIADIFPVCKVSYAPECAGALEFTKALMLEDIVPSCVHSAATYDEFAKVHDCGLRNLSHFCNQMSPLHHRDVGLVGAGLLHDDVFVELICDRIHISDPMIKLVFKVKGCERIMLITDAVVACGLPDGESSLGGLKVVIRDGTVRLADSGALAGSMLQVNRALKNVYEVTNIALSELVKTTSWNQSCACGLPRLGRIEENYLADFVMLDNDFNVTATYVGGNCAWSANA